MYVCLRFTLKKKKEKKNLGLRNDLDENFFDYGEERKKEGKNVCVCVRVREKERKRKIKEKRWREKEKTEKSDKTKICAEHSPEQLYTISIT